MAFAHWREPCYMVFKFSEVRFGLALEAHHCENSNCITQPHRIQLRVIAFNHAIFFQRADAA